MKPGDLIAERFAIERVAGEGAMGVVYAAEDRQRRERVAVKVMAGTSDMDAARRFHRESRTLEALDHPGIVGHVDHGTTEEGAMWLAMEWLQGCDLSDLLKGGPPADLDACLTFAIATSAALGVAHEAGILHRDVKPANVFLVEGQLGRPKLVDFGLARTRAGTRLTQTGMVLGTPSYMAPEQARGQKKLDERVDVYAMGCVLFELCTGRPPFAGQRGLAVLMRTLLETPPLVNDVRSGPPVSTALQDLVNRCLAKDPEARPPHGAALAKELAAIAPRTRIRRRRPSRAEGSTAVLTRQERRLVSVVAAGGRGVHDTVREVPATALGTTGSSVVALDDGDRLRRALAGFDAVVEQLADGGFVVLMAGQGLPTEHAARAARCALTIRSTLPDVPVAVATGRAMQRRSAEAPVGEAIERAVELLLGSSGDRIVVDRVTAGLLPTRFALQEREGELILEGEADELPGARLLLGQPTPCLGRRRELGQLRSSWRYSVEEPDAAALLVTAPAGLGKSRLARELMDEVHRTDPNALMLFGRGDAFLAGAAYSMLAPAFRRWAGLRTGDPLPLQRQKVEASLRRALGGSPIADRIAWFLGEAFGVPFEAEGRVELAAARHDGRLMADQVRAAFCTWLAAEAAQHPVLVVLDDLEHGDRPSVRMVDLALERLGGSPLFVLGLASPEVEDHLPRLWARRDLTQLHLQPLSRRAAAALALQVLGDRASEELMKRIVDRAEGNAFFLEELIRSAAEEVDAELPETVLGMVEARLDGLDSEVRRVLRAASVFGDEFRLEGVATLTVSDPADGVVRDHLARLAAAELIVRRESETQGLEGYRFRSALVREAAYATLTPEDRDLGHRLAADWLAELGETDSLTLAEHYRRGGDGARAARWYARAAREELEGDDFAGAIEAAHQGLVCDPGGEWVAELQLLRAEASGFHGDLEGCAAATEASAEAAEEAGPTWFRALGYRIWSLSLLGEEEALAGALGDLDAVDVPEGAAPLPPVIAYCQAAFARIVRGRYREAMRWVERAEAAVESFGVAIPPLVEGRLTAVRAQLALQSGDLARAARDLRRSAQSYESCGYLRRACGMRTTLGFSYLRAGLWEEARAELEQAVQEAERMGAPHTAATARQNLGLVLARLGRPREGAAVERRAIVTLSDEGDVRMEGNARSYLSLILRASGDLEGAEAEARCALDLLEGFPPSRILARAALADALLGQQRAREALEASRQGMGELMVLRDVEEGEMLLRLVHAQASRAMGDLLGARATIRAARGRLLERAAALSDRRYERGFLEAVPEHAAILEATGTWAR